jgi:8-oxo-dGDP phosphatase
MAISRPRRFARLQLLTRSPGEPVGRKPFSAQKTFRRPVGRALSGVYGRGMDSAGPVIKTVSSRVVYRNPWITVREDEIERPDGSRGLFGVVERADFAVVIAAENGGFHLVEEYRYPVGARKWNFPQGGFPAGVSGTPDELAYRELAEETGLRAGTLTRLGYLHASHGQNTNGFHAYLATDLQSGQPDRELEEQDMRQAFVAREEFEAMIREGRITDDSTVAAYALLLLHERRTVR